MQQVSATEAQQAFTGILDIAQCQPVVIRHQERDVAVLISMQDYARLAQLNLEEFQAFRTEVSRKAQERGLTQGTLDALLDSHE